MKFQARIEREMAPADRWRLVAIPKPVAFLVIEVDGEEFVLPLHRREQFRNIEGEDLLGQAVRHEANGR